MEYDGDCPTRDVSFGSYGLTNAMSENGRMYHLDLYEAGTHATLGFFQEVISYEDARAAAMKALN